MAGRTLVYVILGISSALNSCAGGATTHSNVTSDGAVPGTGGTGESAGAGGTASGGNGGTSKATGGTGAGGLTASGGGSAAGGTSSTGGADAGAGNAAEFARVSGWLTNTSSGLPGYAYTNIKQNFGTPASFDGLVHAIVLSCVEFGPKEKNWLEYCEAVLASAIVAESSYDPKAYVLDAYGKRTVSGTTANDPTVGLLQIRFSSTVNAFNSYGPFDRMTALGCAWPAELRTESDAVFWATKGPDYLTFMESPACNIGLSAWDYFSNATGNGGPSVLYTYQYCQGDGVGGDMIEGLLSHLEGPAYARPADASNSYVTGIKSNFAALLGGLPTPDPFTESLATEQSKYCR